MEDLELKTCPYCREPIRALAIKCRFCGEWLEPLPEAPQIVNRSRTETEFYAAVDTEPGSKPASAEQGHSSRETPSPPTIASPEPRKWRYLSGENNDQESEPVSLTELVSLIDVGDVGFQTHVIKEGWGKSKRAGDVAEIKEAIHKTGYGYGFGYLIAIISVIVALIAFWVAGTGQTVNYFGKRVAPGFDRTSLFVFLGLFYSSFAFCIFKKDKRALHLSYANVIIGIIGVLARGIVLVDLVLYLPSILIALYLNTQRHVLRDTLRWRRKTLAPGRTDERHATSDEELKSECSPQGSDSAETSNQPMSQESLAENGLTRQSIVVDHPSPTTTGAESPANVSHLTLPPVIEPQQPGPPAQSDSPPGKKANYFLRHWRGELTLGVSYWLNGLLATVCFAVAVAIASAFGQMVSLRLTAAGCIFIYVAALAVSLWQILGTWRSASKHVPRGGQAVWAFAAKLALVLGLLNVARVTVGTMVPQIVEFSSILAGDKKIPAYEIRVLPGGTEVEFRGGLRAGSAEELTRILNATPQTKVLHLNSVGGRLREAREMARLVRERGLTTYTSEECLSAATLVFVSGKERVVAARARLGFHRPTLPGMTGEQQRVSNELILRAMQSAGVSREFIDRVLATSHKSMWYPSIEEMQRAGVITSQSFGERFAISGSLLKYSSPEEIDRAFGRVPLFRAIKRLEPPLYQRMVNEFSAAIRAGRTEGEANNRIRPMMEPLVLKYLPAASDDAVLAVRDFWVNILEQFKGKDSHLCIAAISPKSAGTNYNYNFASLLPGWVATNGMIAMEKVLVSATNGSSPLIDAKEAEKDLASIRSRLVPKFGDDWDLLAKEDQWMEHSDRVREMLLAYYLETQKMPRERQGNLLRYALSDASPNSSVSHKPWNIHEMPPAGVTRPYHYKFSHTFLRNVMFANDFAGPFLSALRDQKEENRIMMIRALWGDAGTGLNTENSLAPDGLAVNTFELGDHRALTVVVMPSPKYEGESYFCGIEGPADKGVNTVRSGQLKYYVLERMPIAGKNSGTLIESFKDGTSKSLKADVEPTMSGFIRAVESVGIRKTSDAE